MSRELPTLKQDILKLTQYRSGAQLNVDQLGRVLFEMAERIETLDGEILRLNGELDRRPSLFSSTLTRSRL